jgi:UDP-N-acetylmuramate: L-alanyl-gamma-D-glutamyl-meso-diaminopimelate ligase
MHQLAIALKKKGYKVTGSDDEIFEPARSNLALEGLLPAETGWFPAKIHPGMDAVILGMHARADNPELVRAKELNLKIYSFPEYIFQESIGKTRVVVGGSHGKTTTTSMIMHVLKAAGRPFDYLVGARLEGFDQSVSITSAPLIVCEGDEYPASIIEKRPKFHFLSPHIAVLTGIAWDHINVFPTFDNYLEQFRIFLDKIEPGGSLIYNSTDPVLSRLVQAYPSRIGKKSYDVPAHSIADGKTRISIEGHPTELQVFGDHNLLNLHAAWLVTRELGIDAQTFCQAIASFGGAAKRLELLAKNSRTSIFRDFAHAPSKVRASIQAVKQQFPDRQLIAVLELHTYSSLNSDFMKEYEGTMNSADQAVVFYSPQALSLKRMPDLSVNTVKQGFAKPGLLVFNEQEKMKEWLERQNYQNANLLLMSSGNYDGMDLLTFVKEITS